MTYGKVKELPDCVQSALSDLRYHRADISIEACENISPSYAGGKGRRGFFVIVKLSTGSREELFGSWGGSNPFNPTNQVDRDISSYDLPPGVVVLKGSVGEKTYATMYVHPSNLVQYLPASSESLSDRDRWLLYTFDGLTSAGRRNEWDRRQDPPSEDDLNRLAKEGYLKRSKNGATKITTEGKNILSRRPGQSIEHPSEAKRIAEAQKQYRDAMANPVQELYEDAFEE